MRITLRHIYYMGTSFCYDNEQNKGECITVNDHQNFQRSAEDCLEKTDSIPTHSETAWK